MKVTTKKTTATKFIFKTGPSLLKVSQSLKGKHYRKMEYYIISSLTHITHRRCYVFIAFLYVYVYVCVRSAGCKKSKHNQPWEDDEEDYYDKLEDLRKRACAK